MIIEIVASGSSLQKLVTILLFFLRNTVTMQKMKAKNYNGKKLQNVNAFCQSSVYIVVQVPVEDANYFQVLVYSSGSGSPAKLLHEHLTHRPKFE